MLAVFFTIATCEVHGDTFDKSGWKGLRLSMKQTLLNWLSVRRQGEDLMATDGLLPVS